MKTYNQPTTTILSVSSVESILLVSIQGEGLKYGGEAGKQEGINYLKPM